MAEPEKSTPPPTQHSRPHADLDWTHIARIVLTSRYLDLVEETRLVPEKKVTYQFSARGHELAQALLATQLTHAHDGIGAYYRSRPLMLGLGLPLEEAIAAPLTRSGSYSDGRDIGVVCNYPNPGGPCVLPMSGDVGSQFTPAAGWAQAVRYRHSELGQNDYRNAIAVVLAGDGAIATNGFWSSLVIATTQRLPLLFFVEDNQYGISVPSSFQTPGGDIAANLAAFANLKIWSGDGTDPENACALVRKAVRFVRSGNGPALLRLRVPRLSGHSGQDNQAYKSEEVIAEERQRDPLPRLRSFVEKRDLIENWQELEQLVEEDVESALAKALARPQPDPQTSTRFTFCEFGASGEPIAPERGGTLPSDELDDAHETSSTAEPEPQRINMVAAIRRTLDTELERDHRVVVFGEDVGRKGGVHAATVGLQEKHGESRVFDTSLSEEGIVGRAVGMAIAGLVPVAEIQFRKYADPATEQLFNCGTMRWRTNNRFAAPIVVRMPGGFAKVGDPWHSVSNESMFAHAVGWRVAVPSNAEDAVGLLRSAIRGHDPTIFFEHRAMLDAAFARRGYPGNDYVVPFGAASRLSEGTDITVVSWGAMVERCAAAAETSAHSVEVLDLRTVSPWDEDTVLASVAKTKRCLIVHEDGITAGFGAEISATVGKAAFFELDAPVSRLAVPDVPIPHNDGLMQAVLPNEETIVSTIHDLVTL